MPEYRYLNPLRILTWSVFALVGVVAVSASVDINTWPGKVMPVLIIISVWQTLSAFSAYRYSRRERQRS